MQSTNLISLLKILTTRERTRFGQYIQSPFFNRHEKLIALYDWLQQFAPGYDQKELNRKAAWNAMYTNKPYDELRLNNFTSNLTQLLYSFLAYLQYEQEPLQERLYLFEELLNRQQEKQLSANAKRARQLLDTMEGRSYGYHLWASRLEEQMDKMELHKQQRRYTRHLQQENDELDLYYWINKLRIACDMSSRQAIFKAGYQPTFITFIREQNEAYGVFQDAAPIRVYLTTLAMLEERENSQHFFELKELLKEHTNAFPKDELSILYHYALNYCISRINSGEDNYYQQVLSLYQSMLENGLLILHGHLSQFAYKNIATTGIRLKAYDWTESFLNDYKKYLLPEEQENAIAYNSAALWYAKGDYKKALHFLQNVEFTDTSYHLGVKIIQLKSYYELQETEAFYSLLEAFKKYILRKSSLSDYRRKANTYFLQIARRLYQLRELKEVSFTTTFEKKRQALKKVIDEKEPLANKAWLLEVWERM